MNEKDKIREKIIEAARQRFLTYGYNKTSMAEIAADCGMSPGNLYRYFENKLDISECLIRRHIAVKLEKLRAVLREPGLSAAERLEQFILLELEFTYRRIEQYPTLVETTREFFQARPLLMNEFLAASRALLVECLSAGNATEEFEIDDVLRTAETVQSLTLKLRYPQLHSNLSLDELRYEARGIVALILNGLAGPIEIGAIEAPG